MQILVRTDNHISGREAVAGHVEGVIEGTLARFREHLTRVEAHLSDENGEKGGDRDIRCVLEARVQGRPPLAVTNEAGTLHEAVTGAANKMASSLATVIEKMKRV